MQCRKCKTELPDNAVYCHQCGVKQTVPQRSPKRRGNGQGTAYKRGKTWTAQNTKYRNGKRYVSTKGGFATKKAALEWLAQPNKYNSETITFEQLYNEWSPTHYPTITKKRKQILVAAYKCCAALHSEYWHEIGLKEMQAAVDALPDKYYPRKNLKALFSAMGEYAIIAGYADKSLAKHIKLPPEPIPSKKAFTENDIAALWKDYEAGNDFTGAILIMIFTGMRYGELVSIKPENIHFEESYMMGGIKTRESRAGEIILIDEIKPLVQKLMLDGRLKEMSDTTFKKYFNAALERAGIEPHTPHECRHSTATLLAKHGVQPAIIQAIMRHTKYQQTAEYTHIDRKTKLDAINSITNKLPTK